MHDKYDISICRQLTPTMAFVTVATYTRIMTWLLRLVSVTITISTASRAVMDDLVGYHLHQANLDIFNVHHVRHILPSRSQEP
jgi:hypothetical protein